MHPRHAQSAQCVFSTALWRTPWSTKYPMLATHIASLEAATDLPPEADLPALRKKYA